MSTSEYDANILEWEAKTGLWEEFPDTIAHEGHLR